MQPNFYTSFITRNWLFFFYKSYFFLMLTLIHTSAWGGTDKTMKSKRKNKNIIQHNTIILTMISWSLASHRPTYTPVLAGLELWLNREDIFFFSSSSKKRKRWTAIVQKSWIRCLQSFLVPSANDEQTMLQVRQTLRVW